MKDIEFIKALKNKPLYYIEDGFPYSDSRVHNDDKYDEIIGDGVGDLYYIGQINRAETINEVPGEYYVAIWWNMESGEKDSSHYRLEDFMKLFNSGNFILVDHYDKTLFDEL